MVVLGGTATSAVRLPRQIGIIAAFGAAYFLVRGATDAAYGEAVDNADTLVEFEKSVGMYAEPEMQRAALDVPGLSNVLNWIYIWGHWPVIIGTLIWLARGHPEIYRRTRNAMLLSGGIGLLVFVSFPVAPPRLADLGMLDTVSDQSHAYRVLQPAIFTNQYAALPSLHVGWNLLMGIAIVFAARSVAGKVFGVVMPVTMVSAVVLTANHYIVDAVAGALLTVTCWMVFRPGRPKQGPQKWAAQGWSRPVRPRQPVAAVARPSGVGSRNAR